MRLVRDWDGKLFSKKDVKKDSEKVLSKVLSRVN
jgi:hypothetical protein